MKTSLIGRADKKRHSSDFATVNGIRSLSHRAFIGGSRKMVCLLAALTHMLMFASIGEANSGLPAVDAGLSVYYVANNSTDDLLMTSVNSSGNWTADTKVGGHSSVTTPAILLDAQIYIVYVGNDGQNELKIASSIDGINWGPSYVIPGAKSKFAPAIGIFTTPTDIIGQLSVAYVADDGTNDLYVVTTNNGATSVASALTWNTPVKIEGQRSRTAPAMASFLDQDNDNILVIAYVADNASNDLLITTSNDGIHWTASTQVKGPQDETPQQSPLAPALVYFNVCCSSYNVGQSALLLAYVANNGSNDLLVTISTDALNWTQSSPVQGQQSSVSPALMWLIWEGRTTAVAMAYVATNGSNDLLVTTSSDGIHWSGSSNVGTQTSKIAPALGPSEVQ